MKTCIVKDCGNTSIHAKDMCEMHYRQVLHGKEITHGRPKDWGSREKHPLYERWRWITRHVGKTLCDSWRNDFWTFVKDMGIPENDKFVLTLIDDTKPYSKENCVWKEALVQKQKTESQREYAARYQRTYRMLHPKRVKSTQLRKSFGIGLDEYNRILNSQNGACAICKKKETMINPKTKGIVDLAVDHCHESNRIRGLLCKNCNNMIGYAKDSIETLQSAIEYLKK